MRICILLGGKKDPARVQSALAGEIPRPEYLCLQEALDAEFLDFTDVEDSTHPLVRAARSRGLHYGLAALAFVGRKTYDHFYCTGEEIALPFAVLMAGAGDFGRVTTVVHNAGTKKRNALMRAIPSMVWRNVVCIGREQYRVVTEENGIPKHIVQLFPNWVDTQFYDPSRVSPTEDPRYVFACGRESRDYPTLQRAAAATRVPFHVVASGWWTPLQGAQTDDIAPTENVTLEDRLLPYPELRARYAASRVVAVPVQHVGYGAGLTCIVEAMAMRKVVLVADSPGIVDYVDDGTSGFLYPVGDAGALARLIESLWSDAGRLHDMGVRNRAYAEAHYSVEDYVKRIAGLFGTTPRPGPLLDPSLRFRPPT